MPAPQLTRQQRRKIRRDLVQRGERLIKRGMPAQLAAEDSLGIALALREMGSDPANPQRAAAMAEAAEAMLQRTLAGLTKPLPIACAKGCSWCCHCLVLITPPEIFRVANWLSGRADVQSAQMRERAASEAARRRPMTVQDRFKDQAMCALNWQGACGVYDVRPIPCRALLSLSADACRLGIIEGRGEIPVVTTANEAAEIVRTLLVAAVRSMGLPDDGYELNAGVAAALAMPDAEPRWLAGEDVFADVPHGPRMPAARALEVRIASDIAMLVD